jgi:hypothetical protein
LVELPDLGRAGATNLFRSRPHGTRSSHEWKDDARRKRRAATRERFGLARMLRRSARDRIAELLETAGVHVDGDAPWDMRVHDSRLHARVIAHGSLGLGEAYMDGWWDAEDLDGFLFRALGARLDFENAWPGLRDNYGERFYRMWRFYLSASAATFRCRRNQLWQIVLSPNGVAEGYIALR